MCLSCGCQMPDEDHGNPDHLIKADLDEAGGLDQLPEERITRAAEAAGITSEEVRRNIGTTLASSS